jgi:alkanesulfonate monooxygenase SsuD/methylene tetrahydromethanopterin reductase-like flavin-dependent oxidoreductase (luciferase family)
VGTLVPASDFRHPVIVAHEAASLHHLSGGGLSSAWEQGGDSPNTRRRVFHLRPRGSA